MIIGIVHGNAAYYMRHVTRYGTYGDQLTLTTAFELYNVEFRITFIENKDIDFIFKERVEPGTEDKI